MAASSSDLLLSVGDPGTATTLSAPGYTTGGTSITVGSTSNWPTDTGVVFAIDETEVVNGVEQQVAGTYNEFIGTVASGTSVTNVDWVRGVGDRDYAAGASTRVYVPVSSERENRIVEWGTVEHRQDGTHDIAQIVDDNGLEKLKFTETASAVNEFTIANAATGNAPTLSATGSDTNIDLKLAAKGTGYVYGKFAQEVIVYTPAGNEDYSSGSVGDYISIGNATIPSWAAKVRVTWHATAIQPLTSLNAITFNIKVGSDTGMQVLCFNQNDPLTTSKNITWSEDITLTGTGTQAVKLQAQRTNGASGGCRANTSSDFSVMLTYIP